jgi:hypothetical protein
MMCLLDVLAGVTADRLSKSFTSAAGASHAGGESAAGCQVTMGLHGFAGLVKA